MKLALTALISIAFVACTQSPPPAAKPVEQTVFAPLLKQRDDVQKKVDELPEQRKADLDRAIDQSGQ